MPLIRDEGVTSHGWHSVAADEALTGAAQVIVPRERIAEALESAGNRPVGLALANTADLDELAPDLSRVALITVAFPAFSDGRGFSLARRIRARGFEGELWAAGHLIPDQFAFARACGFDAVLVDEKVFARQSEADWVEAAGSLSLAYQHPEVSWSEGPRSILELRRASRLSRAAE